MSSPRIIYLREVFETYARGVGMSLFTYDTGGGYIADSTARAWQVFQDAQQWLCPEKFIEACPDQPPPLDLCFNEQRITVDDTEEWQSCEQCGGGAVRTLTVKINGKVICEATGGGCFGGDSTEALLPTLLTAWDNATVGDP